MGGLEGRIGLHALQPVPWVSGSCVGREGHGHLVYEVYLVYKELCHLLQYTCRISSCRSLVVFNPWNPGVERNMGFLCIIYVPPRLKGLKTFEARQSGVENAPINSSSRNTRISRSPQYNLLWQKHSREVLLLCG